MRQFASGRRGRLAAGLAAAVVVLGACGSVDDSSPSTTDGGLGPGALPSQRALDLEPVYGTQLAALDLRLTDRGGLIDRSDGGYEPSASGTHLAIYVEPVGDRTFEEYVEGIRDVAVIFGDLFERWPGLESYDVCQEPAGEDPTLGDDDPLPVTQIELTRAQAETIDWSSVSVEELVSMGTAGRGGLTLRVSSLLARHPAYRAVAPDAAATEN